MPAIAPAPPAPPPKPSPQPAPAPAPKPPAPSPGPRRPAPAQPKADDSNLFENAFADLDAIEAKEVAKTGPPKKEKPEAKDERKSSEKNNANNAEEIQADETQQDTNPKAEKTDEAGDKGSKEGEVKPVRAAELRTAYERSKVTLKEKDAEITRLKGELASKSKTEDPEKATLTERLTATEKKLKEYEDEIRFTNYKNHPEFKKEYETPYHNAFAKALADFEQIHVSDEEGNKRLATRNDLDSMLRMSVAQVDELATEKFGHSAARVIRHVEKLRDLADAYHAALEDAKTKGGERETQRSVQEKAQNEQRQKSWQDENDAVTKKYPHWFSPKEGDEEANTALEKGYKLADAVFLHRDQEPPERLIKMDAAVRNKAAGFDRLVLEGKRKDARIAELEKSLKEYEASDPPTDGAEPKSGESSGGWEESAYAELDAIERKSRK